MKSTDMTFHIDKHIGVAGAGIYWMRSKQGKPMFWCRKAIAIMGSFNNPESATMSPFDPKFNDNYVEGKGETKEEALSNMENDMKVISDSLWAV